VFKTKTRGELKEAGLRNTRRETEKHEIQPYIPTRSPVK